ncbi:MAG: HPr family phosphocarrier protein [Planctomycetota bacterium]
MPDVDSVSKRTKVVNRAGLHARPCHAVVSLALKHPAELRVRVGHEARSVNGKSIIDLMTLEASEGTELEFTASGPGAEALVDALVALVAAGFSEPR